MTQAATLAWPSRQEEDRPHCSEGQKREVNLMTPLFVATGDAVVSLTQHGNEWTVARLLKGGMQCLALDPLHPTTLYAGSHGRGLWKSDDSGAHWQALELPQPNVFSVAVSPADGAVYAGCEPSMLFRSADGGITWHELGALRALPSAPTWSFPPRPWTSHVRWIAPNPHDAAILLVGIELGGLMFSSDGGQTWADHRPGAQRDVHALAWHPQVPGRAYEAGGGGAAWSHDGGQTWEPADAGRDRHYTWGLAVDPDDPDCWYVSASTGPGAAHSAGKAQAVIYRWRSNGPWQTLSRGLPQPLDSFPYALAFVGQQLYAGLGDGRIYASQDAGEHWELLRLRGEELERVQALVGIG
jgi:photosystem II stability/assembly factor-like uncharacterized protein